MYKETLGINIHFHTTDLEESSWTMRRNCVNHASGRVWRGGNLSKKVHKLSSMTVQLRPLSLAFSDYFVIWAPKWRFLEQIVCHHVLHSPKRMNEPLQLHLQCRWDPVHFNLDAAAVFAQSRQLLDRDLILSCNLSKLKGPKSSENTFSDIPSCNKHIRKTPSRNLLTFSMLMIVTSGDNINVLNM